jgi:hypothetical protein
VTFEAKVTSSVAGTPSGVVAFLDGTSLLGSATLASGAASFVTSSLAVGSHPVVAAYAGDSNFASSTSPDVSEKITASTGDGGAPDAGDAGAQDAELGDAARDRDGEAEKDAESGDATHDRDGEAEKDAESGDAAHKRDGAAEKDAESGDAHHKQDGDAETGDSGAGNDSGSGGGCGCRVAENQAGDHDLFVLIGGVALAAACGRRRMRLRAKA